MAASAASAGSSDRTRFDEIISKTVLEDSWARINYGTGYLRRCVDRVDPQIMIIEFTAPNFRTGARINLPALLPGELMEMGFTQVSTECISHGFYTEQYDDIFQTPLREGKQKMIVDSPSDEWCPWFSLLPRQFKVAYGSSKPGVQDPKVAPLPIGKAIASPIAELGNILPVAIYPWEPTNRFSIEVMDEPGGLRRLLKTSPTTGVNPPQKLMRVYQKQSFITMVTMRFNRKLMHHLAAFKWGMEFSIELTPTMDVVPNVEGVYRMKSDQPVQVADPMKDPEVKMVTSELMVPPCGYTLFDSEIHNYDQKQGPYEKKLPKPSPKWKDIKNGVYIDAANLFKF